MEPTWEAERRSVSMTWQEGKARLGFRAENIHQNGTGLHARMICLWGGLSLASDLINTEKDAQRTHLANKAWDQLPKSEKESCPKSSYRVVFDDFCRVFWDKWIDQYGVEEELAGGDLAPQPLILQPYLVSGGGTILFGSPGSCKSYLAFLMAQSIHAGVSHFWTVRQMPTLFVNLERGKEGIERRIMLVNQQLGLAPTEPLPRLNARGRSLTDVVTLIERDVDKRGTRLVVLDSISRGGGGGSLTEDDTANRIMDSLNGCCESWLAIAHSPRGDGTHAFGSQMFDAAADVTVQALTQRRTDGVIGVGLQVRKANDIGIPPLAIWALRFDGYGLSEFRPAEKGEFVEIEAGEARSWIEEAKAYLGRVGEASATEISEAVGMERTTVAKALRGDSSIHSRRDGKVVLFSRLSDRTGE